MFTDLYKSLKEQKMKTLPKPFAPYENLTAGVTPQTLNLYKHSIREIISADDLLYEQKRDALAAAALNVLPYPTMSAEAAELISTGVICLLGEGAAPYHPRYVAPDYSKLLREGSAFLELKPARDLFEATSSLLTAYKYIPCAGLPVFIGRLDELLQPYLPEMDEQTAYHLIKTFWLLVDRLNPSAFVHANIGPQSSQAGELLLRADRELKTLTNITLRYDPANTPQAFALRAVENALANAKPYFLNHAMMAADWGDDYVIASCYNGMRLAGGIFTLVRLNLAKAARLSDGSPDDFLERVVPTIARYWLEIIEARAAHIVEEVGWFKDNFWIEEGLLQRENFTSYAGIFGLAEAVNHLMSRSGYAQARFGSDEQANLLAKQITDRIYQELAKNPIAYCEASHGRACFHAQVGIGSDVDVTPAVRVPSGEEPDIYSHLHAEAPNHAWLSGGVSTILEFDQTAAQNPAAVLDIIRGAFSGGIRNLSIGSANSEFVRVTGYLIRRADLEAAKQSKALRHSSAILGSEFMESQPNHLHRITRKV